MKIGVYFNANKYSGGVYQYSLTIIEAVRSIKSTSLVIFSTNHDLPESYLKDKRIKVVYIDEMSKYFSYRILGLIANTFISQGIWLEIFERWSHLSNIRVIEDSKLDLVIYPTSSSLSYLVSTPSIVAIHDLQHKLNPQFKEVSGGGQGRIREYNFARIVKYASRILVDSEIGKEDLLHCYPGADSKKIVILPFLPPSYLKTNITILQAKKILAKYGKFEKYFYYPANFWPHKHHLELLKALKITHQNKLKIHLVLTGNAEVEYSTYPAFMQIAQKYHLTKYIHYLGYVDSQTISSLYRASIGLVMPTHFGPTNIPVLEAWAMGTPVIYSGVRGCLEQLGNAGISVVPTNPNEIARAMISLVQSEQLRSKYIKRGRQRLQLWTEKDFVTRVRKMIQSSHGYPHNHSQR